MEKKIGLMIIGAQKAGTTSLNNYLSQHPNVYTHFSQEFAMFADEASFNKGFDFFHKHNVNESEKNNPEKTFFIPKHVGLMYSPNLMKKLKEYNPDVKVVIVIRNPVDRAYSAFEYCKLIGVEPYVNFEDAIYKNDVARFKGNAKHIKNCDYIGRGSYAEHLKNVYEIFPAENVQVYLFEEIIKDLNLYLNKICAFAGVPGTFTFDTSIRFNERGEARSGLLSKIFAPGQQGILKKIVPFKLRLMLRELLKSKNVVRNDNQNKKVGMAPETRIYLTDIFKKNIPELEKITNLPFRVYWKEFYD